MVHTIVHIYYFSYAQWGVYLSAHSCAMADRVIQEGRKDRITTPKWLLGTLSCFLVGMGRKSIVPRKAGRVL